MVYFPPESDRAYKCPKCKQWFLEGNVRCLVAHPPDTCCHYGDTPIPEPRAEKEV